MPAQPRWVRHRHSPLLVGTALATGLIVAGSPLARAANLSWSGATSADWFDGTNWSPNSVPTAADNVVVNQGSPNVNPAIGINGISNAATSNSAVIGDTAGTTGAVTVNTSNLAVPASWTLSGPSTFSFTLETGPLIVGNNGTGFLNITNGGLVTTTGHIGNVVIGSIGTGTVTVGSATAPNLAHLSTLTNTSPGFNAGTLFVGDTGTGTLIVNPDGAVSGFLGVILGVQPSGRGTVIVNGGSINAINAVFGFGDMTVGASGLGTLTIMNGGTVTSTGGSIAAVAGSAGSSITVTGVNSTWKTGSFVVGAGDTGSLSIQAGGTVNAAGAIVVAMGPTPLGTGNGSGTVTVDNARLIANGAVIDVGVNGSPGSSMTVQNGGQVSSDGAQIGGFAPVSPGTNATGVVTVKGVGSLWDAARDAANAVDTNTSQFEGTNQFFVDNPVNMTGLAIQQGGKVISNAAFVGDFAGQNSVNTVVVDGAGSTWTNLNALSIGYFQSGFGAGNSTGAVNISNGGLVSAPSINVGVLPDGGGGFIDRISVSGAGSILQASGMLTVGQFGTGDLMVFAGATVTSTTAVIGFSSAAPGSLTLTQPGAPSGGSLDANSVGANSVGTVLVTGAGSTWSTGSLIIGDNTNTDTTGTFTGIGGGTASGALTVASGGAVSSTSAIQVALNAGATGAINIGSAHGQAAAAPGTISAPAIVFGAGTGTVVFNHTGTGYDFAIPIQGSGSVIVDSGTTILTANNTYTGPTTINGGMLVVNGSIANSATTVNSGGAISGTGTAGALTVRSGGTFAPGPLAAPGTMTVAGNLAFQSGAIYLVQLTPAAASEAMISGTATLAGTVDTQFAPGSYMKRSYTILSANGGRSGTFDNLVTNLPGFAQSLSYTSTDVILSLSGALGNGTPLNQNQQNVASTLNNFFNNGGALPPGFVGLFGLAGANLGNALSLLDGEVATGSQTSSFQLMSEFLDLMLDPFVDGRSGMSSAGSQAMGFAPDARAEGPSEVSLAYASVLKAPMYKAPPPFEQRATLWGTAFGGYNRTSGDPVVGSNDLTARTGGIAAGMDYRWRPDITIGFALAGGATGWSVANGLGSGRSDAFQAGVYGTTRFGSAYLSAALAYTGQWAQTDRMAVGLDHLTARFDPQGFGGRVEVGYRYALYQLAGTNQLGVTPYAAMQAQSVHIPGYREIDVAAGGFGLNFAAQNASDIRAEVGARFDHTTTLDTMPWTLRARAAYAHDWVSDPQAAAAFQVLPGANFIVTGATPAKDSALLSAGSELKVTRSITLGSKFETQFAAHGQTYAGIGTVRVAW